MLHLYCFGPAAGDRLRLRRFGAPSAALARGGEGGLLDTHFTSRKASSGLLRRTKGTGREGTTGRA